MSLLESWEDDYNISSINNVSSYHGAPTANPDFSNSSPENMIENLVSMGETNQDPIFSLEPVDYKPKGLKILVANSNIIYMGFSTEKKVARLNLDRADIIEEIEITKKNEEQIYKLFLDPSGKHLIISMENEENYYLHLSWKKPKNISKLKGIKIESIAWDKLNTDPSTTREILIGSNKGKIYELCIEANERAFVERIGLGGKDQSFKLIYNFGEPVPITGLRFETFVGQDKKYFVMVTTKTRIYQFVGGPTFEAVFAQYETPAFNEVPGDIPSSELQFFTPFSYTGLPKTFAWLTEPGVFYGSLVFGSQNTGETVMSEWNLIRYPNMDNADFQLPVSLILTEFHFLLLYRNKIQAISILSKDIVWEVPLPVQSKVLGLSHDVVNRTIWLYSEKAIFEITLKDEDRNVWEMYNTQGEYELALQYCKNPLQRDKVWSTRADHFYSKENYRLAAMYYGKTQKSFEEITLKFIEKNEQEALKTYLTSRLETMKENHSHDATQFTLICTWLTELYLDKLNQYEESNSKEKFENMSEEFESFLKQYKDHLDKATTFNLLSSHARMKELLYYATIIEDFDKVISYHIQHGEYNKALEMLTKQSSEDTYYKFSPILMHYIPQETVNAWIQTRNLEPRKLIPALMRYNPANNPKSDKTTNQAIRYLQHCVKKLNNKDPAIHNYLLSLYAQSSDIQPLLHFLKAPETYFDLKYALRLCTKENKIVPCVYIYSAMGLYEEAVELALKEDVELAKDNADKLEDEGLRKKLWLRIAKHIIEQERDKPDIKKAMDLLSSTDGLLKIEDILPFFNDFTLIDDFKQEICTSLEEYNKHIEELKNEMGESTTSADLIRKDIKELRNKFGFVHSNQICEICSYPVLIKEFYLFHCSHLFHTECLREEMMFHLDEVKKRRVDEILQQVNQLNQFGSGSQSLKKKQQEEKDNLISMINKMDKLKEELDDLIASDCPFCGDIMISSISKPFILEEENEREIEMWAI